MRAASRPRSTHSRSTLVGSKTPTRATAEADDGSGTVLHLRRHSTTPQRRLTPIDKQHRNRTTKKRRGRRPEATEVSSQYGGQDGVAGTAGGSGGPKFRVTSGGRRSRLRPLVSRRTRLDMAEMLVRVPVPPAAKPEVNKLPKNSPKTDSHTEVLERGLTFTSSVVVPDVSVEGCRPPSPFQLHYLPLSPSASNSDSDALLRSPPSKSSGTVTPHVAVTTLR